MLPLTHVSKIVRDNAGFDVSTVIKPGQINYSLNSLNISGALLKCVRGVQQGHYGRVIECGHSCIPHCGVPDNAVIEESHYGAGRLRALAQPVVCWCQRPIDLWSGH